MRFKRKNKLEIVTIEHYAPDVTATVLDYGLPVSLDERMRRAERHIRKFLDGTKPDSLCGTFFDPYTEEEESMLVAALHEQVPDRDNLNKSLADRQKAELQRLDSALANTADMIKAYEAEIAALQQLFDSHNS